MKKNYLFALLGALVGGIIATIPWVLVYVYGNMMFSLLAVIVATGALKGYQLCKGKINKRLPLIITIISVLSISIATLIIIPLLLLVKESAAVSIENLKYLYSNSEFVAAMIKDYLVTIIFTFLGISGVINSIKNQTKDITDNDDIKIYLSNGDTTKDRSDIKKYFISKNATTPENAIEINERDNINLKTVELLIKEQIIVKIEDKYYYQETKEQKQNKKKNIKIYILIMIVVIISSITASLNNSKELEKVEHKDFIYQISDNYKEYYEDDVWYYIPKKDLSGYSGLIRIYNYQNYKYSKEWKENIKANLESYEEGAKVNSILEYKNPFNYQVIEFNTSFKEFDEVIYFIFSDENMVAVEVIDYREYDDILKEGKNIVNSFMWSNND